MRQGRGGSLHRHTLTTALPLWVAAAQSHGPLGDCVHPGLELFYLSGEGVGGCPPTHILHWLTDSYWGRC